MAGFFSPSGSPADVLPPRAFDSSVYCLPFTLPSLHVAHKWEDSELYPPSCLFTSLRTHTSRMVPWKVIAADEMALSHDAIDKLTDMGIAGGAGSGSSLSSRARFVPNSKYNEGYGSARVPETSNTHAATPLLRSMSQEVTRATLRQQCDAAALTKDRTVLDKVPGWESQCLDRLPEISAGLPVTRSVNDDDEFWWLHCEYTKLVAGHAESSEFTKHVSFPNGLEPATRVLTVLPSTVSAVRTTTPSASLDRKSGGAVQGLHSAFGETVDEKYEVDGPDDAQLMRTAAAHKALVDLEIQLHSPVHTASMGGGASSAGPLARDGSLQADVHPEEMEPTPDDSEFDAIVDRILATTSSGAVSAPNSQLDSWSSRFSRSKGAEKWAITTRMSDEELEVAEARFSPVHVWPFKLDNFQREAIVHMERDGPSVAIFVAAHTSAGKTVVAEYAIALSISHRARVIYTSPIKALSNQKYHDLKNRFGGKDGKGVGLITGDVTINADAPCLIMTTEILRSMLYRGDDLIHDIEWVIFDEIHYINNEERGLAYEEVLLLLPDTIGLIFLSATSPNKEEFAEWIGRTKLKHVYVLGTAKRPVALQHFLYVDKSLYLLMDGAAMDAGDSQGWRTGNYKAAAEKLGERMAGRGSATAFGPVRGSRAGMAGNGKGKDSKQIWSNFVTLMQQRDLLPCIIFCFSKKLCEECAFDGLSSADLTHKKEKAHIYLFLESAVRRLSVADRTLPQIIKLRGLLLRGIGVHHAGLLPILKECVEILFSRGLVKILFATETFAMGINMPARSVAYNGIRKFEGSTHRYLSAGEYIQMAGRAGRRGLDVRGTVILMCWGDSLPKLEDLHEMMCGKPTRLVSQFRLTYNMILNILRTDIPVTQMMARSYAEFATQRALGGKDVRALLARGIKRLHEVQAEARAVPCVMKAPGKLDDGLLDIEDAADHLEGSHVFRNEEQISVYATKFALMERIHHTLLRKIAAVRPISSVLTPGRVVVLEQVSLPHVVNTLAGGTFGPALRRADSAGSISSLNDTATIHLHNTPAVILHFVRPADVVANIDAMLTVLVLCPPALQRQSPLGSESLFHPKESSIAPAGAGKKSDDGDLEALLGKGAKGKGSRSKVTNATNPLQQDLDRTVGMDYFHAVTLSPGGSRTFAVLHVGLRQVARVTGCVIDDKVALQVLSGSGSLNALIASAHALWDLLSEYKADVTHTQQPRIKVVEFTHAAYKLPALHPSRDLRPPETRLELLELHHNACSIEKELAAMKCSGCPRFDRQWQGQRKISRLQDQLAAVNARFSIEALALYPEMQSRFGVLRSLHYTKAAGEPDAVSTGSSDVAGARQIALDIVALKGRVAAEVNTCDELIFTEMLFEAILNPLSPAECAALLSALVYQERSKGSTAAFPAIQAEDGSIVSISEVSKLAAACSASADIGKSSDDDDVLVDAELASNVAEAAGGISHAADTTATDGSFELEEAAAAPYEGPNVNAIPQQLAIAYERLLEIAVALGRIQQHAGLPDIIPAEYARQRLNYGLLLPTYAWACGVPFSSICRLTEVPEGTIVRTISRLDETCREVRNAARILGNSNLFRKMEVASAAIKRDVIFATSLYL